MTNRRLIYNVEKAAVRTCGACSEPGFVSDAPMERAHNRAAEVGGATGYRRGGAFDAHGLCLIISARLKIAEVICSIYFGRALYRFKLQAGILILVGILYCRYYHAGDWYL